MEEMQDTLSPPPILVAHLFQEISERLIALLRNLGPADWHRPTLSSRRNVKDIASHLLDGSLRRLSNQRDGYRSPDGACVPRGNESVPAFLNRLNAEWEAATRRLSPRVLIGLIEEADRELAEFFESLDPDAPAIFPVAWAGEESSWNWMDVARDFTEKWHHMQQIFEATGRPSTIVARHLYHPCLETFMRALPVVYRSVSVVEGTASTVKVTGESGGEWHVRRVKDGWKQVQHISAPARAVISIPQESAWKIFTTRRPVQEILAEYRDIEFEGDRELALPVLEMVCVMA